MMNPKQNVGKWSHLECARGKQVRGNSVVGCENGLRDEVPGTNWIAGMVAVSDICMGLPNICDINCLGKAPKDFELDQRLSTYDR